MKEPSTRSRRPEDMTSPIRTTLVVMAITVAVAIGACSIFPAASSQSTTAAQAARLALAQQARFAGIGPFDQKLIGQAAWYKVAASGDGWEVLVRIGWGDCPAGCINQHRWTYSVARNGSVKLEDEAGDPLPAATGVRGTVTAGPTCPVIRDPPDSNCADRPVAGAILAFSAATGTEVARVTSNEEGTFVVELAPGSYRVAVNPVEGYMGTPTPMDVEVEAGQPMAELQISFDTGIRG
ncbi:MAG: carboxypeptidase-like regulatory domain-containing protein [Chloroflexota bacterium]